MAETLAKRCLRFFVSLPTNLMYMVSLRELFFIFFKIGAFTLGGGYAMLTMVEQAIVTKKKYIEKDEFWDLIAVLQSLPGVFALNTALYVGYKLRGRWGAFWASLGAVLPSFIAILLIAMCFTEIKGNEYVERLFRGIRPCVVALIAVPAVNLIKKNCKNWVTILIALVSAGLIWWFKISPIWIIVVVSIAAVAYGMYNYKKMEGGDK